MGNVRSRRVKNNKKKKKGNLFLYLLMMVMSAGLAAVAAFNLYLASLPPISNFEDIKPNPVTSIYSSDGENIKTFTVFRFEKVSIKDIPNNLKYAIIATEDKNFYHHRGFDTVGLLRSVIVNLKAGSAKQGASTITQQLARILFLSNERTFDRKIKELIIAHRIEKTISKDEILEMYLNSVYLGSGTYGVLSASKTYFNKNLNELTLAEAALIAGLPQAPSVYSPLQNPKKSIERRNQVLKRLYKTGYITREQYEKSINEELHLSKKSRMYSINKAPYFIDFVLRELEYIGFREEDISQGGLKIYTTLDYRAQEAADNAINTRLNAAKLTGDKTQMALFSFSPTTGKIYAYIGGKNYEKSQYDRILNAVRPPGSSFKPFVYATALQQGVKVNDIVNDAPVSFGRWAPRNYGGKYRGRMPVWQALAVSSNVVAVKMIEKVGVPNVIATAREMGITTPLQSDMTIALGSNGVKLYDMVIAYGAFANGGFRVRPYAVERVENSRGVVVYENPGPKNVKVISYDTAAGMTYMLQKVVEVGTGRAANIGRVVAGKTGTTDDYRDAWFVGYTPDVVTGVWLGNDNNSKLPGITGGLMPAQVWADYMKVALINYPNSVFDYPKPDTSGGGEVIITEEPTEKMEEDDNSDINLGEDMPAPLPEVSKDKKQSDEGAEKEKKRRDKDKDKEREKEKEKEKDKDKVMQPAEPTIVTPSKPFNAETAPVQPNQGSVGSSNVPLPDGN